MDFTQIVRPELIPALMFAIATIIGVVNLIQQTFPAVKGVFGLLVAVLIGVVMGLTGFIGLNIELGIIAAFAGSGIYKVAQKAGGN